MGNILAFLANLLRGGKPGPEGQPSFGGPPPDDVSDDGTPAPPATLKPKGSLIGVGQPAAGNTGGAPVPQQQQHSPELDELMGDYRKQRDVLMQKPDTPEVNPLQSAVAGLIGLGAKSPVVAQKAFGAPSAIADQDAASSNAALEQQQKGAAAAMGHTGSMIKAYLDRDSQADKIGELIQTATMKDATTRLLAGWRQNVQLTDALTKYVSGDGNPMFQPTAQGVGTILQQQALAQGINMSDAAAAAAGQQWISNLQPSDVTKMKMAAQAATAAHQQTQDSTVRMKTIGDQKRYETDPAAMFNLYEQEWRSQNPNVYLDPATEASLHQAAAMRAQLNFGSQQGKIDLDTKRGNAAVASGNLADARAAAEAVRKNHLGGLMDAQAAKANADAHKANVAAGQITGVGPNGKPITGTARFNAMNTVTAAQIKADGQVTYWTGIADQLAKDAHDPNHVFVGKDGNKIEDPDQLGAARLALQNQAAAAAFMRDRYALESKQRAAQLASIQSPPAPSGGNVPVTLPAGKIGGKIDLGNGMFATPIKGG